MAHLVPLDVIREIISYVDDIDVRRSFQVYAKLQSVDTKYSNIAQVLRCRPPINRDFYMRYYLQNLYDSPARSEQRIENDMMDVSVDVVDDSVKYRLYLFRLKPKTGAKEKEAFNLFHKGNLDDWYWDYVYYTHCNA